MSRYLKRAGIALMWTLALFVGAFNLRYLVLSPAANDAFEAHSAASFSKFAPKRPLPVFAFASHNRPLLLLHIAGGFVALIVGLFQFLPRLRSQRPAIHRRLGKIYLAAVAIGSAGGLPLSYLALRHMPDDIRQALLPTTLAFATLAITWPILTGMAYLRVRQRRFDEHRAWMMRSYALTFAAVTTRLISPITLFLTRDALLAININIWTWPLNLLVAEWLIRREQMRLAPAHPAT